MPKYWMINITIFGFIFAAASIVKSDQKQSPTSSASAFSTRGFEHAPPPPEIFMKLEAVAPDVASKAPESGAAPGPLAPDAPVVARTKPFAFLESEALWRENGLKVRRDVNGVLEIEVCWINPADDPADRKGRELSQTAIEKTWNTSGVVRFIGRGPVWTKCVDGDLGGLRINIADEWPWAKIGVEAGTLDVGMILNFSFKEWGAPCADITYRREDCIYSLAVHEFGHTLGFRHEHVRLFMDGGAIDNIPTAQLAAFKKSCVDASATTPEDRPLPQNAITTVYDARSVMNYCFNIYNQKIMVTRDDLAGLQTAYGRR